MLIQGVEAWNHWRKQNPRTTPNLNGATFSRTGLSGADFQKSLLAIANFSGTDFSGANLSDANLFGTDLIGANLSGANLHGANLSKADLSGVNFSGANLHLTVFGDCDLSETKGLHTCIHGGPSILDFRTLQRSGQLPLSFLRGCGLPDNLIDYLPTLLNQPIQFYSCFISYSYRDNEFAKRLHADLQNNGVRCWFAFHDLAIGARTRDTIDQAVRLRDKLLVVLSKNSINSDWVEEEVEMALEEERNSASRRTILFPIRIDDAVLESERAWARKLRRERHVGNFIGWRNHDAYSKSLERLLRDLKVGPET
jgi:uncharacterized protein YjbI with pentapeptide repeats